MKGPFKTILIITILVAGPLCAQDEIPVDLVSKASDWYYEVELVEDRAFTRVLDFEELCTRLDSLVSLFMPIDTISGFKGDERVWQIAECYTQLGMYDEAVRWWLILRRNDEEEYFRLESNRGLLKTGVALADTTMVGGLLGGVDLWETEIKKKLAPELLAAIDFLYLAGWDARWLVMRYERLKRFLPSFEAGVLQARLSIASERPKEAFDTARGLLESFDPAVNSTDHAKALLELLFSSSLLSGKFTYAGKLLDQVELYGCPQLVEKVAYWRPALLMLGRKHMEAAREYTKVCTASSGDADACFWKDFIGRYRETLADVEN